MVRQGVRRTCIYIYAVSPIFLDSRSSPKLVRQMTVASWTCFERARHENVVSPGHDRASFKNFDKQGTELVAHHRLLTLDDDSFGDDDRPCHWR